jgi:hypothetical protein
MGVRIWSGLETRQIDGVFPEQTSSQARIVMKNSQQNVTATHLRARVLRLLRGLRKSFLAVSTQWQTTAFLQAKGATRVCLLGLDRSSDCFRTVRSEKSGGKFLIVAQRT